MGKPIPSLNSHMITVCLVDDDDLYRKRIERWISEANGFRVLGSYPDAESALTAIERSMPDVVLLDFALPGLRGGECIRRIRERAPAVGLLVLSGIPDNSVVFESVGAGADGFLDKDDVNEAKLLRELREVHEGGHPLSRRAWQLTSEVLHEYRSRQSQPERPGFLTQREYEVALLLWRKATDKEIAQKLGISLLTVYSHVRNIFEKTHAHNRREAVFKLWGIR